MIEGHSIGDGIIVAALAGAFIAYLYFKHLDRQRRLEIVHAERLAAMDKGIPLPELPLDPVKLPRPPDPRAPLVHHGLKSFRGDATFSSWIYRIGFNQALNLKARVRHRAPHVSDDALSGMASAEADPLSELEAGRRKRAVLECVAELPEVYQSALRLHYRMGASVAEAAALLDVPDNTVKSYLHRARRLLHAMLDERGFR